MDTSFSSGSPAGSSYTVLRIKRKATEQPLSSLVIQDTPPQSRGIKKRLVSLRNRGVFRLAETVPETWEGRGQEGETLKERIKGLLSRKDERSSESPVPLPVPSAPPNPSTSAQQQSQPVSQILSAAPSIPEAGPSKKRNIEETATSQNISTDGISSAKGRSISPEVVHPRRTSSIPRPTTQYRVVPPSISSGRPIPQKAAAMMPPKVVTYADLEAQNSPFVFLDAQAVGPTKEEVSKKEEEEMESFLPMLQEYLKLESSKDVLEPPKPAAEEEEQWVYDLYYRDNRNLDVGVGDGVTPMSIGALLGYEDFSPPSSVSSSEPEDEADEDSNEEDYYRNDYPEDEDADEDMREYIDALSDGEDDDGWSEDGRGGGGSSEGERGAWDYR